MDASNAAAARGPGTILAALAGAVLVGLFALQPPWSVTGVLAMAVVLSAAAILVPGSVRILVLPVGALTVLLGQFSPALNYADPWLAGLAVVAIVGTLLSRDRRVFEFHRPSLLAAMFLAAPLPALVTTVVSLESWAGAYKNHVLLVGTFFALRRLVPREHANTLLWVFPLVGSVGALQILAKTQGLGAMLFSRLDLRNFYTRLPWGQSNFISAVLELALCGTILLLLIDRRPIARLGNLVAAVLMLQGILVSFSRAGAVSLLAYAAVLGIGLGGRRGLGAVVAAAVVLVGGLLTPGGAVLLQRFTDPTEYGSWAVRVVLWENALQRFAAHPWSGIGLNQGRYQSDFQGGAGAHNLFLDAAMEQGIVGPIILLLILVAMVRLVRRIPAPQGAESARSVRVFGLALVAQLLVHASVEPIILGMPIAVMLVYFLAWLCLKDDPAARPVEEWSEPEPGRVRP